MGRDRSHSQIFVRLCHMFVMPLAFDMSDLGISSAEREISHALVSQNCYLCFWWQVILAKYQHIGPYTDQISNILYSDKNAFIRLPQLHVAGLLYSGLEPPISSKLLLPKLQYNLGSLMVSLDLSLQGLSERMAKVKRFLWALNFTKSWFSQHSLVEN